MQLVLKTLKKPGSENNLTYIKSNSAKLTATVDKLQKQYILLLSSIEIRSTSLLKIYTIQRPLKKSPIIHWRKIVVPALVKISKVLTGEDASENVNGFPEYLNRNDSEFFLIRTRDVSSGRSRLLSNDRRSLKFENSRKRLIIQRNSRS